VRERGKEGEGEESGKREGAYRYTKKAPSVSRHTLSVPPPWEKMKTSKASFAEGKGGVRKQKSFPQKCVRKREKRLSEDVNEIKY
jgi:hypothetical protein